MATQRKRDKAKKRRKSYEKQRNLAHNKPGGVGGRRLRAGEALPDSKKTRLNKKQRLQKATDDRKARTAPQSTASGR